MLVACYELWVETTDDDWTRTTLVEVQDDGQTSVLATREWAPPVSSWAVNRWVQKNTDLTKCGVLVLR